MDTLVYVYQKKSQSTPLFPNVSFLFPLKNMPTVDQVTLDDKGSFCAGCGARIVDRFYLMAVDREWHAECLKCSECSLRLDNELTCFTRDGAILCREDYYK